MKFTQKLDDADHRYIFRIFFRRRYPWGVHMLMTAIIAGLAAWQHFTGQPQAMASLIVAGIYLLTTLYIWPKYMEYKVLKNVKKSISYGRELHYNVDEYGIAYTVASGKKYQFHWKDLTQAFMTSRGVFLRFGKRTGICFFEPHLGQETYAKLLEVLRQNQVNPQMRNY